MSSKTKIMIVDDSELILEVIGSTLRAAGYDVVTRSVSIGTGAAILRERPALVLMDVSMPLVTGTEISESLRSSSATHGGIIVLHSDRPAEELAVLAEQCGADGFIRKTGDARELRAEVAKWLASPRRATGSPRDLSVLVAGSSETCALVREVAGPRGRVQATDSGTEAFRVMCSRGGPQGVVIGSSLQDLSVLVLWQRAVLLDPRWQRRIVVVDEGGRTTQPWPEPMIRWSRSEPIARLRQLLEQTGQAGGPS